MITSVVFTQAIRKHALQEWRSVPTAFCRRHRPHCRRHRAMPTVAVGTGSSASGPVGTGHTAVGIDQSRRHRLCRRQSRRHRVRRHIVFQNYFSQLLFFKNKIFIFFNSTPNFPFFAFFKFWMYHLATQLIIGQSTCLGQIFHSVTHPEIAPAQASLTSEFFQINY